MTGMDIILQIIGALALVAVVAGLTALYWRRVVREVRATAHDKYERLKTDHEAGVNNQLDQQLQFMHMDRIKDRLTISRQARMLRSKLDFYYQVLYEVHTLHDGMSSYMKLLTSADLEPGQDEWNMVCSHLDERAGILREMVGSTLELMRYEDMTTIDKKDEVPVNDFCHEVFSSCQPFLAGDLDLRLETQLEDDETVQSNIQCLKRVLTCLLRCSMQFTHEGEIVLEVNRRKGNLVFTVSDTGMGIPEYARDSAFETMHDTDISIKIVVVRLRLCRAIVRLLGGTIALDPHYQNGTSIVFTIQV